MASSFQQRVEAAFGGANLNAAPQPSGSWAVSEQQVHRAGKDADYSSDEEEQARAADAQRERLLPEGLLRFEGGQDGEDGQELPSHAFCRALDDEDDFDAHDALASGVMGEGRGERRPPRHTEVLEDNVFEVRSRARALSGSEPGAMEIEPSRPNAPPPAGDVAAAGTADQEEPPAPPAAVADDGKAGKRVRFAEPAKDAAPSGRPPLGAVGTPRSWRPPQRARGGSKGLSYVPDHVRHPERYTAYALEEPIEVGSGKAGAGSGRENMQAARAAQAAASAAAGREEAGAAPLELPSFGGGIAFTPRSQRDSDSKSDGREPARGAAEANQGGVAVHLAADEAAAADEMEVVAEEPAGGSGGQAEGGSEFAARGKRQRNLRSRAA